MKTSLICIETVCGRISPAGFGSSADRIFLEKARERTGATLLGAESLRAGDPEFRIPGGKIPENRIRAVITRSGNIPLERSLFIRGPMPVIFCLAGLAREMKNRFLNRARIKGLPETASGMLSLSHALKYMEKRGAQSCLIEGGGRLNYEALQQDIVDEILVTMAPRIIGKDSESSLVSGPSELGAPFLDLELVSCRPELDTGEVFLHYRVKRRK